MFVRPFPLHLSKFSRFIMQALADPLMGLDPIVVRPMADLIKQSVTKAATAQTVSQLGNKQYKIDGLGYWDPVSLVYWTNIVVSGTIQAELALDGGSQALVRTLTVTSGLNSTPLLILDHANFLEMFKNKFLDNNIVGSVGANMFNMDMPIINASGGKSHSNFVQQRIAVHSAGNGYSLGIPIGAMLGIKKFLPLFNESIIISEVRDSDHVALTTNGIAKTGTNALTELSGASHITYDIYLPRAADLIAEQKSLERTRPSFHRVAMAYHTGDIIANSRTGLASLKVDGLSYRSLQGLFFMFQDVTWAGDYTARNLTKYAYPEGLANYRGQFGTRSFPDQPVRVAGLQPATAGVYTGNNGEMYGLMQTLGRYLAIGGPAANRQPAPIYSNFSQAGARGGGDAGEEFVGTLITGNGAPFEGLNIKDSGSLTISMQLDTARTPTLQLIVVAVYDEEWKYDYDRGYKAFH